MKIILICFLLGGANDSYCQSNTDTSAITQVVLLGTGTPGPSPERSGPCTAIVVNNTAYLVDLGPGVVRRAMAAFNKGITGLYFSKLKIAFITHLHSDHTVGYPDFIFTPWVVGRTGPLKVFGPSGIKEMTNHILSAWKEDIDIRTNGLEKNFPQHNNTGYLVDVTEIKPGIIYKDSNVTVKAFLIKHGDWKTAYGYRFETPDRIIVISGDTSPAQSIIDNCNGCDILIHEVYTEKAQTTSDSAWQAYRLKYHTSSKQLSELATKARPKLLILYHQHYGITLDKNNKNYIRPLSTEQDLINEMHQYYKGRFISGHDLDVFK